MGGGGRGEKLYCHGLFYMVVNSQRCFGRSIMFLLEL